MEHWADYNIGIDDHEVKAWLGFLHEAPGSLLCQFLGRIVPEDCILVLDSIFGRNLQRDSAIRM